eukprot:GFUD01026727.1.p1 GENE.GFUD01026727.1~~GFUD01026727.1.p1  ORF type:complete len:589 (+),score=147.44 GFUD01026727.1:79-1845(+)
MDTSSYPLILDLLAKNVAKYTAEAEAETDDINKEMFRGKKRRISDNEAGKNKRKKTGGIEQKSKQNSFARTNHLKCELKTRVKTKDLEFNEVKSESHEYTEIKTEITLNDKENVVVNADFLETKPTSIELSRLQEEVKVKVTQTEVNCEVKRDERNIISKKPIKNGKRNNQLILDLLAKSVAKVNADEAEAEIEDNKYLETFGRKKRKHLKEKKKTELKNKPFRNCNSLAETNHVKCEPKNEMKTEYIKLTDDTDVKTNFIDNKPTKIKLKEEIDTDDIRSFPIKVDFKEVTDEKQIRVQNTIEDNVSKPIRKSKNRRNQDKNKETTQDLDLDASSTETRKTQRKVGTKRKRFTAEEDQIVLKSIKEFGDKINITKLAKQLNRRSDVIIRRIKKLNSKIVSRDRRDFTLMEDLVIMDAVLVQLPEKPLEMIDLSYAEWNCIGAPQSRDKSCLDARWKLYLKPWLLQFFSGTLNLDIRRMLANYLAEHFADIDSVDWYSVASKQKFAGHTMQSLRYIFFNRLLPQTKKGISSNQEVTLKDVAEYANVQFKDGRSKMCHPNTLTRQNEVIDYFNKHVEKQGIGNFELYCN